MPHFNQARHPPSPPDSTSSPSDSNEPDEATPDADAEAEADDAQSSHSADAQQSIRPLVDLPVYLFGNITDDEKTRLHVVGGAKSSGYAAQSHSGRVSPIFSGY